MDAISYSYADKQAKRIKKFIENPDSSSGIVTVPKTIASGETVTIPAGRVAVLPNVQVDGTLNVEGDVFIPSGATFGDLESQIALKADTSYVNNKYSGFKNYIINGCMRVAQRGNGPFNTNGYGIDQWYSYISSTTSNITRNWMGTGINPYSYAQVAVGAGSDTITLGQRLEHPYKFSGKTLTLSMVLYNGNYTGTNVPYEIALSHSGGYTVLFSGNLEFSSTSRVSVTFTIPDLSGYTLNVSSFLEIRPVHIQNRGFTGVFGIRDIQLEEGLVATPFEQRPYGLELSLCQRYFYSYLANTGSTAPYDREATGAAGVSSGNAAYRVSQDHPVTMRAIPTVWYSGTISLWNGSIETSVTSILNNNSTITTRSIDYNVASAFGVAPQPTKELITQGAKISVSAEL